MYTLRFQKSALRDFRGLSSAIAHRLKPVFRGLEVNPRSRGTSKIQGLKDCYRVRSGDYRVLYQIDDKVSIVLILRIAHRRDAYRF